MPKRILLLEQENKNWRFLLNWGFEFESSSLPRVRSTDGEKSALRKGGIGIWLGGNTKSKSTSRTGRKEELALLFLLLCLVLAAPTQ